MADPIDISSMPDPTTIGLSPTAQADPTAGMLTPAQLFKQHHGYDAQAPEEIAEFMRNPDATPDVRKAKSGREGLSMLTGLPSIVAQANPITPIVAGAVGGLNALPASIGSILSGTVGNNPDEAARLGEVAREKLRSGAGAVYNLANYLPSKIITKEGQGYADAVLGLPQAVAKSAAPAISSVIGEPATTTLGEYMGDAATLLPGLGAKGVARGALKLGKAGYDAAKASLATAEPPPGTTYDQAGNAQAPSTTIKPDLDKPVTGDDLRAQPNPIPAPEGTIHRTLTEEGRSPAAPAAAAAPKPSAPAPVFESPDAEPTATPTATPTGPAAPSAAEPSPSPAEEPSAQEPPAQRAGATAAGDSQRGSAQLFNTPADTGPQATPEPAQQSARAQHLNDIDQLSGGMLPSRRASAISGDYNATGDDYQLKEVGSEPMRQQLASENDAMHAAAENVHASTGSQFSNSVDPQTLSDRGRVTRGAIQKIQDWFETATNQAYDKARANSGDKPMPNFLGRVDSFLKDESNYMPDNFRRAAQARLNQLKTAGDSGISSGSTPAAPSSVAAAEKFREWLNSNRTLDNMHTVRQMVEHTDTDVAEHGGATLFETARAARRHQYQMLEEPTGIRKLLTPADSQGINHAIPEHKVMDYIADLPREQHEQVLKVLRAGAHLGDGKLADDSAGAIREIQAHMISRMHDAATNADGTWNARKFYNQASSYAPKLGDTFKDQPKTLRNLQTINRAGNTLSMDKHYPGATAQAERTGLGTKVLQGVGGVASSLAHEIPFAGRLVGRGIEGAVEGMSEKSREAARDKAAMSRLVDRNGKQRGSVQLFNDNDLNQGRDRDTFHGKVIGNLRSEYDANSQLAGGRQRLSAEQNDIINRLGGGRPLGERVGGGKQRGAVGEPSQRDAIQHESEERGGVVHHRYSVPSEAGALGPAGQMHVTEYPDRNVRQVSSSSIVPSNRGQGWGTRMLQRAADDAHADGQVLHSDAQVSDGAAGAYSNLKKLGYDVTKKDADHIQGAYHAVGDHVFEVRPGASKAPLGAKIPGQRGSVQVMRGDYEAPDELKNFIRKMAPAHRVDENGPANWEDLKARRNEKVMPINPQGAEGSIYGDVPTNIAFRAWHDKTHLDVNGGFDHDGELATAKEQLRQAQKAGLSEESQRALWADTWETFKHHEDNGEFPQNPRAFVASRMADKTPLGERVAAAKQRGAGSTVPGDEVVQHVMKVHYPEEKTLATKDPKQRERDVRELLGPDANGSYRKVDYPLDRIHNDTPISSGVIKRYAERETPYPAIVMNKAGEVRDGNHRIEAARMRGDETIPAYVPLGHKIPGQRGSVKVLNDDLTEEGGGGSMINVGLHQGQPGDKGFRKMSKQEAQAAVESTGAKVTKNTVLMPKEGGPFEPTSVMSTDRPLTHEEMQSVLAKTKQSAIPQRTDDGVESMHVAPGHEERAASEGWDKFSGDYFRGHDGRSLTEAASGPAYPPHPNATVKNPTQSKFPGIYDDPKEIMSRVETQPESPHLKEIFGKTRKDLHDDAVSRGDVEPKTPIPGIAPKGKGSMHALRVMTPENAERIRNIISAFKEHDESAYHGMVGWYEMDPMYHSIKKILGGNTGAADRVYHNLNSMTSYASPMSPVVREIKRGTAAAMMAAEGNFDKFAKYGNLPQKKAPAALKAKNFELGNEGSMAHGSQAPAMGRFLKTGQEANAVKTGTYRRASDAPSRTGSDYQNTQPVGDSHWSRGVGLADVRAAKAYEGSAEGTEMKVLAPWYHDQIARHPDINLPSTSAQAVQWGALSHETGVDTKIGAPKLEIWADQIANAAERAGIKPIEMWERIVRRLAK